MPELWLAEMADSFWEAAGGFSPDFEATVLFTLPLSLERLPTLTVRQTEQWLTARNFALPGLGQVPDRRLRACLVAHGAPGNFILLDKTDPADEQLFSLAHEVAHFLLDYVQPRRKAQTNFATTILEVLDGLRSPSLEERIEGLLAGVRVGQYEHFMERDSVGGVLSEPVLRAESRADQLALELLAPEETALPLVQAAIRAKPSYAFRLSAAIQVLSQTFSLPATVAQPYAVQLVQLAGGQTTFREWLNL